MKGKPIQCPTGRRLGKLTKAGEVIMLILASILLGSLLLIIADNTPTIIRQIAGIVIAVELFAVAILRIDKVTAHCL